MLNERKFLRVDPFGAGVSRCGKPPMREMRDLEQADLLEDRWAVEASGTALWPVS
jgi:hypothetical protein